MRKLISEDKVLLSQILGDLSQFNSRAAQVRVAYEELSLGAFNAKVLAELQKEGIAPIVEKYLQSIEDDITRLKIKSDVLKHNMRSGASGPIETMRRAWSDFERFSPNLPGSRTIGLTRQDIIFDDEEGEFIVSPETKERIADEHCRVYIKPGTIGEQLHENIEKFIEVFQEFIALQKDLDLGLRTDMGLGVVDRFILNRGSDNMQVNPDHIKGAIGFKAFKARMQRK